jgi:Leu/Phe-tRNA-protein transferase
VVDAGQALQLQEVLLLATELTVAALLRAYNTGLQVWFGKKRRVSDL